MKMIREGDMVFKDREWVITDVVWGRRGVKEFTRNINHDYLYGYWRLVSFNVEKRGLRFICTAVLLMTAEAEMTRLSIEGGSSTPEPTLVLSNEQADELAKVVEAEATVTAEATATATAKKRKKKGGE